MIEYKRHFEQFEMIDEKFKNEHCKKITNIHRKFKVETKDETKLDIVYGIISFSIHIFLYLFQVLQILFQESKKGNLTLKN